MSLRPPPWRRLAGLGGWLGVAAIVTACGSAPPQRGGERAPKPVPRSSLPPASGDRDGPEANPPPDLHRVPDARPRVEPLRQGGPNKPYEIDGTAYTPMTRDEPALERGLASWYGRKFHGRRTASGEVYNMYAMTAAHPTFPIPSYARVRNPANGREVVVRINDRGPFKHGRVIDLSYTAALKLDLLHGVAPVEVERLTHEAIRTGSWRRDDDDETAALATAEAPPRAGDGAAATATTAAAPATPAPAPAAAETRVAAIGGAPRAEAAIALPPLPAETPPEAPAWPASAATPQPPPELLPQERAHTQAGRGWWLQLGAFKAAEGAAQFQRKLGGEARWLSPLMTLFSESRLHKLQAGPFPSRDEALAAGARLREELRLVPMLVERR